MFRVAICQNIFTFAGCVFVCHRWLCCAVAHQASSFKVDLQFAAMFIRPVECQVGKLICLVCTVVNVCPICLASCSSASASAGDHKAQIESAGAVDV